MPPCHTPWLPPMVRVSFNLSLRARLVYLSTHPLGSTSSFLDLMPYVSLSHSLPPLGLPQLLLNFVSPVFLTVFDCTFSLFHIPASLRLTAHPVSHGSCRTFIPSVKFVLRPEFSAMLRFVPLSSLPH